MSKQTPSVDAPIREFVVSEKEAIWRVIPEFPLYRINQLGDVEHRWNGTRLQEIQNVRTGSWFYSLHKANDKGKYARNYKRLLYTAFPEILCDWKDIPGFEGEYMYNKDRLVMGTRLYTLVRENNGSVRLRANGKQVTLRIKDLDLSVFEEDNGEEIKAA